MDESVLSGDVPRLFDWSPAVRWNWYAQNRIAPHERSGLYVFTNYDGALTENDHGSFDVDQLNGMIVLYIGRGSDLNVRISDYLDQQVKCQPELVELLNSQPGKIFIRWTQCCNAEADLIATLWPVYNREFRTLRGDHHDLVKDFRWWPPRRWDRYKKNRQAPDDPGIYVFTSYFQDLAKNVGSVPDNVNAETLEWQSLVLYVGQSTNIKNRLKNYIDAERAPEKIPQLSRRNFAVLLRDHGDRIYVRWVRNFIYEEELIKSLDPLFNDKLTKF